MEIGMQLIFYVLTVWQCAHPESRVIYKRLYCVFHDSVVGAPHDCECLACFTDRVFTCW